MYYTNVIEFDVIFAVQFVSLHPQVDNRIKFIEPDLYET